MMDKGLNGLRIHPITKETYTQVIRGLKEISFVMKYQKEGDNKTIQKIEDLIEWLIYYRQFAR